jgi:hypothetical protein
MWNMIETIKNRENISQDHIPEKFKQTLKLVKQPFIFCEKNV